MSVGIQENGSDARSRLIGIIAICAASLGWAVIEWLGSRITGSSPYQVVWTRYGIHLLLLILIVGPRQRGRLIKTSRPFLQVFRSLLMLTMPVCFVMAARRGMDMKDIWAITWMAVPVMMGFAVWLLGEKIPASQWAMMITGLAGVWLMLKPPSPHSLFSIFLAIGSAVSLGLYAVLTRLLRNEYTGTNLFHTALWVFIPLSFYMPSVWQMPSLPVAMVMMAIGVVGLGLLFLLDRALAHAPASLVAPFLFTESIWTVALRSVHHFSGMGRLGYVGATMILGSSLLILAREFRGRPAKPSQQVAFR